MCSKPQFEFLTQLILLNLTKTLTNNNSLMSNEHDIFNVSVENAPLEPPTPPRTPIIASQIDATTNSQRNATTPIDGNSKTRSRVIEQNVHKSPQSVNNDVESVITTSRPSSPWSNVSQAAASTSISVAPISKLMGNDTNFGADRLSRTSSTNDATGRDENSDADQEDEDEDNSSATHAFDLSFQYNDDSNMSGSGEDQRSEGGTTTNSFELARKDNFADRSNDVSNNVLIFVSSDTF